MGQGRQPNKRGTIVLGTSCFVIIVGLFLIPYIIDYYLSPEELIRNTTRAIENLTGTRIQIADAKLSLLEGITFTGVRVLVPEEKMKLEPAFKTEDALLLKADTFHIKLRRRGFLGLRFRLGAITVANPQFQLTHLEDQKRWNWQMLVAGSTTNPAQRRTFGLGPPISLENGRIALTRVKDGRRSSLGRINFTAQAVPNVPEQYYRLTLSTWTARAKGPTLSIDFNPRTGTILTGNLEAIRLQDIQETIPEPYKTWLRRFGLSGKISIPEVEYRHEERNRLTLILEGFQGDIPLSREEYNHPEGKTFIRLSDMSGKLIFTPREVIIPKLTGRLNGASCQINGTCQGYSTDPDNLTVNLHVVCKGFSCPDYTNAEKRAYIEAYLPWKLRCFFHDFKPVGNLDLDLFLAKPGAAKSGMTLAGLVQARQLSVEYYKFPYRLDNLTGSVRLTNGGFELIGLTGFSGGGKAIVNGTISEPSRFARISLQITSFRTPFDRKLFSALTKPYQDIWKKLNLAGFADTRIELHQPYGPDQPWQTKINASLVEASGTYEGFKYPLSNLSGGLQFDNNLLELRDVTGQNGSGKVTLNGTIRCVEKPNPEISLGIRAHNITIDKGLMDLIPDAPGRILRDCELTGLADLSGTLSAGPRRSMDYRFACDLRNAGLRYKDFPYPVKQLAAHLEIDPQKAVISALRAERGLQKITGQGTLAFAPGGRIALTLNAENLNLDALLYGALDPAQKTTWDLIKPAGKVGVQARLERENTRPWKWDLVLTLQQAAFQYKKLSRITDLQGQILFSPQQAVLKNLTGKIDQQWAAETDGAITTVDNKTCINLSRLNIEGTQISEDFLALLNGASLAKDLQWKPGGIFSCNLDHLSAEFAPDNRQTWELGGKIAFRNANVETFDLVPTQFDYTGSLYWSGEASQFAMKGRFALHSYNWNNRQIRSIRADLLKKIDSRALVIDRLKARYAGGQISGIGNLQFEPGRRAYGLQLTLDNLDAGTALKLDKRQNGVHGKLRGEIFIQGVLGEKYSRQGGGTLQIVEAQAMRMPLLAQIYQTVNNETPNLASFNDITVQFTLEQHKANLQRLELVSPGLSLVGSGTFNLSNDRVNLNPHPPGPVEGNVP
jgi:hypothetical protein